jgi:hypothetical protein
MECWVFFNVFSDFSVYGLLSVAGRGLTWLWWVGDACWRLSFGTPCWMLGRFGREAHRVGFGPFPFYFAGGLGLLHANVPCRYRGRWRLISLMSRLRLIIMSILAVFAVSVVAAASASAGSLHWYNEAGTKLSEGVELLVMATGGTQVLKGEVGGVTVTITCPGVDVHGWVLNPSGGGPGVTLQLLLYLGCEVEPSTLLCKIPEKMIHTSVIGILEGDETLPGIQFFPDPTTNSVFVNIVFEGCKQAGLNGPHPVEGSALGMVNNMTSSVTIFEPKAGSMLKFASNGALLSSGAVEVLMEGGGKIKAEL